LYGSSGSRRFSRSELPAASTAKSFFIRTQTDLTSARQHPFDLVVWSWNDVHADQFTYPASRCRTRVCRGLNGPDITANKDRHVPGADVLFADQLDIRGFDHGIGGLDGTDKSFGLDHSECF
jgi:hypothetical protein